MNNPPNPGYSVRDKQVVNWSVTFLVLWVSFSFTKLVEFPGASFRFLGIIGFTLLYLIYFFFTRSADLIRFNRFSGLTILALVGVISIGVISSFFAINPFESLLPISFLITRVALILILGHAFQNGLELKSLAFLFTLIGLVMGSYGLLELALVGNNPIGLQSNSNFFSSAQVLILPFTCLSLYLERGIRRFWAISSLTVIVLSVILAETRSSVVASVVFFSSAALIYFWHINIKEKSFKNWFIYGVVICAICFTTVLLYQNRNSLIVLTSPEHILQDNAKVKSAAERLTLWKNSYSIAKENPLIGVGPGNWKIHFSGLEGPPNRVALGRKVVVRAHNVYIEILCEMGVLGLIMYLGFVYFTYKRSSRNINEDIYSIVPNALFIAGFTAFLVDQFFSFPDTNPTHLVYVSIILSYIFFTKSIIERGSSTVSASRRLYFIVLVCLICLATLFISFFAFETRMNNAKKSVLMRNTDKAIEELNSASTIYPGLNTEGDSPAYLRALIYNAKGSADLALSELGEARQLNPYNSRIANAIGDSYYIKRDYLLALSFFKKAYQVQSENSSLREKIGLCYFMLEEYQQCIEMLERVSVKKGSYTFQVLQKARLEVKDR